MLSHKEQYEHPFWRRKTTEILIRDDFTCRCCGEDKKQLHVHHLYYEKGLHVWEYDNETLVTLCNNCHKIIHSDMAKLSGILAFEIVSGKIDATDFLNRIKSEYNGKG